MEGMKFKYKMPVISPVPYNKKESFLDTVFYYSRKIEIFDQFEVEIVGGDTIIIPAGFICDGASIPKILRDMLSPFGILFIPSIIHDFAYSYHSLIMRKGSNYYYGQKMSKEDADKLFFKFANFVNGRTFINRMAYCAVKFFGSKAWKLITLQGGK